MEGGTLTGRREGRPPTVGQAGSPSDSGRPERCGEGAGARRFRPGPPRTRLETASQIQRSPRIDRKPSRRPGPVSTRPGRRSRRSRIGRGGAREAPCTQAPPASTWGGGPKARAQGAGPKRGMRGTQGRRRRNGSEGAEPEARNGGHGTEGAEWKARRRRRGAEGDRVAGLTGLASFDLETE